MPHVFITRPIPEIATSMISPHATVETWNEERPIPADVLAAKLTTCDAVIPMLGDTIDGAMLRNARDLKVIANYAVGFNNIDVATATELGITVGNTPDVVTDATADIAFALMIGAARRVGEGHTDVRGGNWAPWSPTHMIGLDLVGQTIGIIGMGRIGQAMARRCRLGFNMRVIYFDPKVAAPIPRELDAKPVSLMQLLSDSDFISIHCDLNKSSRNLIGRREFEFMKPTAVLVNTARGPIVNTDALVGALRNRQIFAAGIDVVDPEPLPTGHPLASLPNALLTPHVGTSTPRTRHEMAEMVADNVIAGLTGADLPTWVNPEVAAKRR